MAFVPQNVCFKEEKRAPQFETYPIYIFKQKNIVLHTPSYHKKRDVAILDPYGNCSGWLCCQVDRVKALHEQYRDDKDAVLTPTGVHFIGPGGRVENEAEHCARLAHNCRMRFNRSFTGLGIQNWWNLLINLGALFLTCLFFFPTKGSPLNTALLLF